MMPACGSANIPTVFSALSGTRLLACLIVRDDVSIIETWAGAEPTVTALLDHAAGDNTGDRKLPSVL
jgi:hypothetical protein